MNWRRITDVEIITELTQRGYVVRRNASPRLIQVSVADPAPPDFADQALVAIKERLSLEYIDIEKSTSANGIEMHTASLRIL